MTNASSIQKITNANVDMGLRERLARAVRMETQTKAPQQKNNSYKKQRRSTRGDFPVACTVIFNPMPHAGTNAQQLGLCGEFIQSCVFVNEQVEDKTDFQTKTNDE